MIELKANQLYRNTHPNGMGWCCHGLVRIVDDAGKLWAVDTYWNQGLRRDSQCGREWPAEQIKEYLTFIIDLGECDSFNYCPEDYTVRAERDRAWIPIGGGGAMYFVRRNSSPDRVSQRFHYEDVIRNARSGIASKQRIIAEYKKKLLELTTAEQVRRAALEKERDALAAALGKIKAIVELPDGPIDDDIAALAQINEVVKGLDPATILVARDTTIRREARRAALVEAAEIASYEIDAGIVEAQLRKMVDA